MDMDNDAWRIFAAAVLTGGPNEQPGTPLPAGEDAGVTSVPDAAPAVPPKPRTDAYRALPDGTARAAAKAYWEEQAALATREPEQLKVSA